MLDYQQVAQSVHQISKIMHNLKFCLNYKKKLNKMKKLKIMYLKTKIGDRVLDHLD